MNYTIDKLIELFKLIRFKRITDGALNVETFEVSERKKTTLGNYNDWIIDVEAQFASTDQYEKLWTTLVDTQFKRAFNIDTFRYIKETKILELTLRIRLPQGA